MSYRTSYRTELRSESSGGEIPRFRRRMLADVGHEVLRPLQPPNARVLCQGSSEVRAADPGRAPGPLCQTAGRSGSSCTGCDLRVMSRQGHTPAVTTRRIRPIASAWRRLSQPQRLRASRCVSPRLGQRSGQKGRGRKPGQPSPSRPAGLHRLSYAAYPPRGPNPLRLCQRRLALRTLANKRYRDGRSAVMLLAVDNGIEKPPARALPRRDAGVERMQRAGRRRGWRTLLAHAARAPEAVGPVGTSPAADRRAPRPASPADIDDETFPREQLTPSAAMERTGGSQCQQGQTLCRTGRRRRPRGCVLRIRQRARAAGRTRLSRTGTYTFKVDPIGTKIGSIAVRVSDDTRRHLDRRKPVRRQASGARAEAREKTNLRILPVELMACRAGPHPSSRYRTVSHLTRRLNRTLASQLLSQVRNQNSPAVPADAAEVENSMWNRNLPVSSEA